MTTIGPKSRIRFGTDGWRAVIGDGFTFENVRLIAHAAARTFDSKKTRRPKVFIGYDHRFLAKKFAEEVAWVLARYHFEPCLLPCAVTSPFLSFVTWKGRSPFGIMITASHNPAEYLGVKVKGAFGGSISQESALRIEKELDPLTAQARGGNSFLRAEQEREKTKAISAAEAQVPAYLSYLKKHVDFPLLQRTHAPVCFDALYGPSATLIKKFFEMIESRILVQVLHNWRDPLFGGLHPEPIEKYLAALKESVKKSRSIAGFALDGDGDRLGVIAENGAYLTPQQVFALLVYYSASVKQLKGKVVQTVSLGVLSERIARDFNLPFEEVPVGFKYVAEKMLKEDVLAGGEESGGYAFGKSREMKAKQTLLPERDGLFSALIFLEMLLRNGKKASDLLKNLQTRYGKSCYIRKDLPLEHPIEDKSDFIRKLQNRFPNRWLGSCIKEMRTTDGLKIVLQDDSWLLLRPSGTEPLLRAYAEFPKMNLAEESLAKISKLLYNVLNR